MKDVISIIIPIFNAEKYLQECIDSIINQTHKKLEIILINDGSTDESEKICKSYSLKDKRIIYKQQENKGVSVARNYGISLATGEFITFIDADDYIEKNMYEVLLKNIRKNNADISIVGNKKIYANEIESNSRHIIEGTLSSEETFHNLLIASEISETIGIGVWNKLFKTNIVKNYKFPEGVKNCEELIFLFKTIECSKKIHYINLPLYNYRQVKASASRKSYNINNTISSYNFKSEIIKSYSKLKEDGEKFYIKRLLGSYNVVYVSKYKNKKESLEYIIKELGQYKEHINHLNISKYNKLYFKNKILYNLLLKLRKIKSELLKEKKILFD